MAIEHQGNVGLLAPERRLQVLVLGLDEFPFGLADTQRTKLLALGLIENGCDVKVVSRWWSSTPWELARQATAEGFLGPIRYINACGTLIRPRSWIIRKLLRLWGLVHELGIIVSSSFKGRLDLALVSTHSFGEILYFWLVSKVCGFPLFLNKVELCTATLRDSGALLRLNARLYDFQAPRLMKGNLPISDYLVDQTRSCAPGIPVLKVPVLVDRSRYEGLSRTPECTYFLYAGYLAYLGVVEFIIRAFEKTHAPDSVLLYLVVNGNAEEMARFEAILAASSARARIRVYSKLTDLELSKLYLNAYALLIPLRPTPQDIARFPHKIGEYCASGRPMVTTNIGEVKSYFKDGKNAYVAQNYEESEYARMLERTLKDPLEAEQVGREAASLAEENFDYHRNGAVLKAFLRSIMPGPPRVSTDRRTAIKPEFAP
jgi:glycosyltransferase involved in cell wall biosynthesis